MTSVIMYLVGDTEEIHGRHDIILANVISTERMPRGSVLH